MKSFVALFLILFLTSCDDGDLKLESFNFDTAAVQKCATKNFLFKINSNEILILNIPETSFGNTVTTIANPVLVPIGGSNSIVYRKYNGPTTNGLICNDLPPSSPVVSQEWFATGGEVQIITTAVESSPNVISGYTHNIVFLNVNFYNPNNSFSFQSYNFGNYETTL